MAIVKTVKTCTGAIVNLHDDTYINNTPEQNRMLRNETMIIAERILMSYAAKQLECAMAYEQRQHLAARGSCAD